MKTLIAAVMDKEGNEFKAVIIPLEDEKVLVYDEKENCFVKTKADLKRDWKILGSKEIELLPDEEIKEEFLVNGWEELINK